MKQTENEKLVSVKLRKDSKMKMEIIKAYFANTEDLSTQKIGKSDYALVQTLIDSEYERIKPELTKLLNPSAE